jgi:two-component system cell cycle sensor histidine kinase/response regulator CckA
MIAIDPEVKVIVASGYAEDKEGKEALDAGAKQFMTKPYRLKKMIATAREVLDS